MLFRNIPKFNLNKNNTSLLVIDAQKSFIDPKGYLAKMINEKGIESEFKYYFSSLPETINNIQKILEKCRNIELKIFFTKRIIPSNGVTDFKYQYETISQTKIDTAIIEELSPKTGEVVIKKKCDNPFNCGDLFKKLRGSGISNVIITGIRSPGYLNTTALDAADRGFGTIVVSDACTGGVPYGTRYLSGGLVKTKNTKKLLEILCDMEGA